MLWCIACNVEVMLAFERVIIIDVQVGGFVDTLLGVLQYTISETHAGYVFSKIGAGNFFLA